MSNKVFVSSTGVHVGPAGVKFSGPTGTICCCGGSGQCYVQFTIEWNCVDCVWGTVTHGAKTCRSTPPATGWVRTAGVRCIYTQWVATGDACVASDCSAATLPANPAVPAGSLTNANSSYPCYNVAERPDDCLPTYPTCPSGTVNYTVTISGVDDSYCDYLGATIKASKTVNGTYPLVGTCCDGYGSLVIPGTGGSPGAAGAIGIIHLKTCGVWAWFFNANNDCCHPTAANPSVSSSGHIFFINYTQSNCIPLTGWVPLPGAATGADGFPTDTSVISFANDSCPGGGTMTITSP